MNQVPESHYARPCVARLEFLQRGPKRLLHEAMKVKPVLMESPECWQCKTLGYLLRKAASVELNWPEREAVCAAGSRAGTGII